MTTRFTRRAVLVNGVAMFATCGIIPAIPGFCEVRSETTGQQPKFNVGDLVEDESGCRLFVQAGIFKDGYWQYDLGRENDILVRNVPEKKLTKV